MKDSFHSNFNIQPAYTNFQLFYTNIYERQIHSLNFSVLLYTEEQVLLHAIEVDTFTTPNNQ